MTDKLVTQRRCIPIVFTDLDGTLLNHNDYDYEPAQAALNRLKQMQVPVVLASSKTRAEMAVVQAELQLGAPMICENGGGIHWPAEWEHAPQREEAVSYHEICQIIDGLTSNVRRAFSGFGDWSLDKLMAETGLPPDMARRAAEREYSEPGIWTGTDEDLADFTNHLRKHGLQLMRGGRFYTICGLATKASRLREIRDHYMSVVFPKRIIHTIALGDAPNDIAMLQATDQAFIVANPHGAGIATLPEEASGKIRRSQLAGPAGWNECVLKAIGELDSPGIKHIQASPT